MMPDTAIASTNIDITRARNAEGLRKKIGPAKSSAPLPDKTGVPPLLAKLVADYAATGLPPAYIADPKTIQDPTNDPSGENT